MSPAFIAILWLPSVPLVIGIGVVIHLAQKRGVKFNTLFPTLLAKLIKWGFLVAFAFAAFIIVSTAITNSPQGPLMLLFTTISFALGEIIGLVLWARKSYAT